MHVVNPLNEDTSMVFAGPCMQVSVQLEMEAFPCRSVNMIAQCIRHRFQEDIANRLQERHREPKEQQAGQYDRKQQRTSMALLPGALDCLEVGFSPRVYSAVGLSNSCAAILSLPRSIERNYARPAGLLYRLGRSHSPGYALPTQSTERIHECLRSGCRSSFFFERHCEYPVLHPIESTISEHLVILVSFTQPIRSIRKRCIKIRANSVWGSKSLKGRPL